MPVGSASCLESVDSECANIDGNSVHFKTSVKYLGVHLDRTLLMQKHISSICCASILELRRIASIRPYLSQSAALRLVAAMVICRLDYCNSVFTGLPADHIAPLQRVQNNAARLVMEKKKTKSPNTASQGTSLVTSKIPLKILLTTILKGLYLLIFLHLSALMNRLALSDLLMKNC